MTADDLEASGHAPWQRDKQPIAEHARVWKGREWVPLDAAIAALQFWQRRDYEHRLSYSYSATPCQLQSNKDGLMSPIERAARALCENPSEDPDELIEMMSGPPVRRWEAEVWRVYAVLDAVRQPELRAALKPFADCAEQIADSESDEEWARFRLTVGDYRRAYAAFLATNAPEKVKG
jgi:hypothetical protein